MQPMMKAVVMHQPGGPEVLRVEQRPVPMPQAGQVLIRVEAFGLNRSELFTRQGHSPGVAFPRVLGIEAAGTVADAPGGEFRAGQVVATVMGGMGRQFDGSYAEYTMVPAHKVQAIDTDLPWSQLGALPEMLQTAWGSLFRALRLTAADRLLIRGGTTSVGLAAAAIAKANGAEVGATSRSPSGEALVRAAGANRFFLDNGAIAKTVHTQWGGGADKVLESIGTTTLQDSLRATREPGIVCMAGMVGDRLAASIALLRTEFRTRVPVSRLADAAAMSLTAFHMRFKQLTLLTPIQFQKRLRLIEARRLMVQQGSSASQAAFDVGYESVSQFTREYARMFGAPPKRDSLSAAHRSEHKGSGSMVPYRTAA